MQPHPTLPAHYDSLKDKQKFLRGIFDRTARHYEAICRWGSFGSGDWYRREALKRGGLQPGMRVLDVAAGTGITSRAAIRCGVQSVVCVDASLGMLREAKNSLPVAAAQGLADRLPFHDGRFDFLTMGFALRHVETLENAFREYRRVLRPGGTVLILDTIKPSGKAGQKFARWYFHDVLPWFARRCTGNSETGTLLEYYWDTIDQMVPTDQVLAALRGAGFSDVTYKVFFGTFCEYRGVAS
jgi:demethylmenaquinone methyltransferase/2-methoxy-6-polyprenyl-1,4-benzoquinol methylase